MVSALFPRVAEVTAENAHPGRDVLFERIDAFRFAGSARGRMTVRSLPLGSVSLATVESTGHDIVLSEPGRASFLLPLSGRLGVEAGAQSLAAAPQGALFLRGGHRMTTVRPDGRDRFLAVVALAPERGRQGTQRPVVQGRAFSPASWPPAASALDGFLRYFVGHYAQPDSPLRRPAALRAAEAMILDLFAELAAQDGGEAERARTPGEGRVRRAEEFMHAHADEPLTMQDVASATGIGLRALQLAFRTLRGSSPRAALEQMRLERARETLLAPPPAAGVTDIALLAGFTHLGRFAAAYRSRFGESPSETLRRARG